MYNSFFAATPTENYFSELSRSFTNTSFQSQASLQVILILSFVVMVLIGIIVVMWRINKKKAAYVPHGWMLNPQSIKQLLNTALDQRSKFELQFHADQSKRRSTFCTPTEVNNSLTLEAAGLKDISKSWIGREVDCFFRIQDDAKNFTYYTFTTPIAGIRPVSSEICHIHLTLPEKLERRQKRASLRVDPPEQYILGVAIWAGQERAGGKFSMNLKEWGKPALTFVPGKKQQLRLANVSAGGIKLEIKRMYAKESGLPFNIGDLLMVLLDLWEPETGQRQRYWIACRVRNPFIDFDTRDVELGLQFLNQLQLQENSQYELEIKPSPVRFEIDEIGNWAMRRHLELYREKGLD